MADTTNTWLKITDGGAAVAYAWRKWMWRRLPDRSVSRTYLCSVQGALD
jgi:hypothetical protein